MNGADCWISFSVDPLTLTASFDVVHPTFPWPAYKQGGIWLPFQPPQGGSAGWLLLNLTCTYHPSSALLIALHFITEIFKLKSWCCYLNSVLITSHRNDTRSITTQQYIIISRILYVSSALHGGASSQPTDNIWMCIFTAEYVQCGVCTRLYSTVNQTFTQMVEDAANKLYWSVILSTTQPYSISTPEQTTHQYLIRRVVAGRSGLSYSAP